MGRIVSNFFISLDGVVESPDKWHFPYFDDDMGAAVDRGMTNARAFLMGRVLYQEWAGYWPSWRRDATRPPGEPQDDAGAFADFINGIPKYVVSNTLREASWQNTTLVSGDVEAKLRELKQRTDGDIAMSGSATLVRWLLANGLLDELNLLVHPIAVGRGKRLFENTPTHPLRLAKHEVFASGVLNLCYVPAATPKS